MRQIRGRTSLVRLFFVVVAASALAFAGMLAIQSAEAGGATLTADCSETSARQLVAQHNLNDFDLPDPVVQVLCGSFTGAGSEAMALTIAAPTCWGVQHWAVFSFTGGAWQLVLDKHLFIFRLTAVGSDIRETAPVWRPGDPRCLPSGGKHARVWHWDGARLVAGAWKQTQAGDPKAKGFYSPSHNIYCGMSDDRNYRGVECASYKPQQKARLKLSGKVSICRGRDLIHNTCNLGNPGEDTPTLAYGRQATVGRFRCRSQKSGMRCVVIQSGKGFVISRSGVTRLG
jgi:hypothetical protein